MKLNFSFKIYHLAALVGTVFFICTLQYNAVSSKSQKVINLALEFKFSTYRFFSILTDFTTSMDKYCGMNHNLWSSIDTVFSIQAEKSTKHVTLKQFWEILANRKISVHGKMHPKLLLTIKNLRYSTKKQIQDSFEVHNFMELSVGWNCK